MAVSLKHSKTSAVTDSGDTTLVQPSDWNAEHVLTQGTGTLLGRTTAGTGATEEISPSSELTLTTGTLGIASSISGKTLTSATVITDNSSSAALRITQIGAGNALVVEDDTNPDASPFIVDSTGRLLVGTTTAAGKVSIYDAASASLFVQGDATINVVAQRSSTDTTNAAFIARKSRGTVASPAAVATGDNIGALNYAAYGGTNFRTVTQIQSSVEAYVSDTDIASNLRFLTSTAGSAAGTEKMRISASGNVAIGTTATTGGKLVVVGTSGTPQAVIGTSANSWSANVFDSDTAYLTASGSNILAVAVGAASNVPLAFLTNNTEKMRITAAGNVGIGTSTPTEKLVVAGPTIVGGQTTANQTSAGSFDHNIAANSTRILSWGASGVTGDITFWTGSGNSGATQRMRIEGGGNVGIGTATPTQMLTVNGAVGYNAPVTVTDATHTVADTTNWLIANRAGTVTLTLPAAASYTGRILTVKNVQAQTVVSNASNVVPIGSTTAGTAILTNTAGKFATMVSNGTNWVIMQAN